MRQLNGSVSVLACLILFSGCASAQDLNPSDFVNPPSDYRPIVTIEEGAGYAAPLDVAARRAIGELKAGGIVISPQGEPDRRREMDWAAISTMRLGLLDEYPEGASPWLPKALPGEARFGSYLADGNAGPGKAESHGFMTPAWFSAMREVLDMAEAAGLPAVYYDEAGFPSGKADHTLPPQYNRQILERREQTVSSSQAYTLDISQERPSALVALNSSSGERIDLMALEQDGAIHWTAPRGKWRVQGFYVKRAQSSGNSVDYYAASDYLDPEATNWFISSNYDRAYEGLSDYFGSTIKYTFFDDVGVYPDEKTWHPSVGERFEELTGKPASLYYPALWDDIGPETSAARVAFFRARAEILGETFPKLVSSWAARHGVQATGHAPGNYDIQPTDTIGDPFKFYAYVDIPMADVLWGIGFARGGFKLISSVSAQRDLPMTAAEAFSVTHDANGYRRMIELYVRGFNFFVTGARVPSEPFGTHAQLNEWAGRSSYLLRGGRHMADIAIVFPIESLQAFYSFNSPGFSSELPAGTYVYADADYQAVGEMLLSNLHRDFTFIHPDTLASDQFDVESGQLIMRNKVNQQTFRTVIIPGGEVLSAAALARVKAHYDAGGSVIATSLLPSRSAEFGRDQEIRDMIAAIFGEPEAGGELRANRNSAGGQSVFVAKPSPDTLAAAFDLLGLRPEVELEGRPNPTSGNGVFGYTHRQRGDREIYYFGNSSDTLVDTRVRLRGRLSDVQLWNPHDGTIVDVAGVTHRNSGNGDTTEFNLTVPGVSSRAIVATRN